MAGRAAISSSEGVMMRAVASAAALHALVAVALVMSAQPTLMQVSPEIAVSLELAAPELVAEVEPLQVASPTDPLPLQVQSQAEATPAPAPKPVPMSAVVVTPVVKPATAMPPRPSRIVVATQRAALSVPTQQPVAPSPVPVLLAPSQAWRGMLDAWLRTHRIYPTLARRRGEQGVVALRFTVRRDGRVIDVALANSSGSALLDEAATALLSDAVVPEFTADMGNAAMAVTVAVNYRLN